MSTIDTNLKLVDSCRFALTLLKSKPFGETMYLSKMVCNWRRKQSNASNPDNNMSYRSKGPVVSSLDSYRSTQPLDRTLSYRFKMKLLW